MIGSEVVQARDLTVRYGDRIAIENVSFTVHSGEQIAVVGPNGAGKSTLFKALAGLIEPMAGTIQVHDHPAGVHACIAYLQQRSQVDWTFPVSVYEVVMMGRTAAIGLLRRPRPEDHAAVRDALESVDMAPLASRQIGELSGGQQQRMFIARALAQHADLLLMDEPFSGLDVDAEREILDVLNRLEKSGVSVLLATHDLDLAADHFDRVMLMNRRLIAIGVPAEVFTEDHLRQVYHGAIRLLDVDGGRVVLGDIGAGAKGHP